MRSLNLSRKLLVRLVLLILHFSNVHAGFLDFYQDVKPEQPVDVNYEEIARYLEAQKQASMRDVGRTRIMPNIPWQYDEYLDYRRQKEKKILEALLENPNILDAIENRRSNEHEELQQQFQPRYDDAREDLTRGLSDQLSMEENRPYANAGPLTRDGFDDYTKVSKIPYAENIFRNEKPRYTQNSAYPMRINPLGKENYPIERDLDDAERLMKLEGKLMDMNERIDSTNDDERLSSNSEPEFTFKFDQPKTNEPDVFAIRPNDPRYYEDETSTETTLVMDDKTTPKRDDIIDISSRDFINEERENVENAKKEAGYSTENGENDKFSIMKVAPPESHRQADPDSVIVSPSRVMSNDIYFIAIVAGCSAAAMFALVLISLTWCRLHRGAKAAADIEYPAYGVTGPNKDISPSGDQRLAHSAQMYHFQHQKQQIIAMENRTAASRDPGSVSEADSDEENEEGDYTVYECPGLASTGEMEVKNPMFHDDPTPATPPPIHKDGDDI